MTRTQIIAELSSELEGRMTRAERLRILIREDPMGRGDSRRMELEYVEGVTFGLAYALQLLRKHR